MLAMVMACVPAHRLLAQTVTPPGGPLGIPDFAGTGLSGLYYDDSNGMTSADGNPAAASFTTTNLCFPDCQGNSFGDGNGGLTAFGNGNINNIDIFGSGAPLRNSWNNSELDITGFIAITQPGTYNFTVGSDDNTFLDIQGQSAASILGGGPQTFSDFFSAAGLYAISVQFLEFGGGSRLSFVGTDPNGNCIFGCYDGSTILPNDLFYSAAQLNGAPAPSVGTGWAGLTIAALFAAGAKFRRRLQRA
jgi:hypothetical protein